MVKNERKKKEIEKVKGVTKLQKNSNKIRNNSNKYVDKERKNKIEKIK